jgi:hypothetical protein
MAHPVTVNAVALCPHGGQVHWIAHDRITIDGAPLAEPLASTIIGCLATDPCRVVHWPNLSGRTEVDQRGTLLSTSIGITTPNGSPVTIASPTAGRVHIAS